MAAESTPKRSSSRLIPLIILALIVSVVVFSIVLDAILRRGPDPFEKERSHVTAEYERLEEAQKKYAPKTQSNNGRLDVDALPILKQIPGVREAQLIRKAKKPASRIIHIMHMSPEAQSAGESEEAYATRLANAEISQLEIRSILKCLIRYHGLKSVWLEGITPDNVKKWKDAVRKLASSNGHGAFSLSEIVSARLSSNQRLHILELGAVGWLVREGEAIDVFGPEDPKFSGVQQIFDKMPDKKTLKNLVGDLEQRESAIVQAMLKRNGGVIVLSMLNDLSNNCPNDCEYIWVYLGKKPGSK